MKTLDFLKSGARLIGTLFAVIVLIPLCIALVVSVGGVLLGIRDSYLERTDEGLFYHKVSWIGYEDPVRARMSSQGRVWIYRDREWHELSRRIEVRGDNDFAEHEE